MTDQTSSQHSPQASLSTFIAGHVSTFPRSRRQQASTWRTAGTLWLLEIGPNWPTPESRKQFSSHCRGRFNMTYAVALTRVIEAWQESLAASGVWQYEAPPETPPTATLVVQNLGTGTAQVTLHPDSAASVAEAVFQKVFGGEASEDYWAVIMRTVSTRVGTDGVAAMLNVDRDTAERFVRNRKVPRHAKSSMEALHAMLVLRGSKDYDLDELQDRMLELGAYDRGGVQ